MHRVGLVLGGGGITGGAYQLAAMMALELATGWDPNDAEVVIGTSAGASVAAIVRSGRLSLDCIVRPHETREHVAERIRSTIYRRGGARKVGRWVRHGIASGVISPGVTFAVGAPAVYDPEGIADWVRSQAGAAADEWPDRPTAIVAMDVASKRRIVFGTVEAPDVSLADAVAASSAIPLVFNPHVIEGRSYVDGGVRSGTHADLVLGLSEPLDLLLVLPPLAQPERRRGARFYENLFDRVGHQALEEEIEMIQREWPTTDILVLRPPPGALAAMRPNPMDATAAVPSFVRTLTGLRTSLAEPDVWRMLRRHLITTRPADIRRS